MLWRRAAFGPAMIFLLALKASAAGSGGSTAFRDGQQQNLVGQGLILPFHGLCGEMEFKSQFAWSAGVSQLAQSVDAGAGQPVVPS